MKPISPFAILHLVDDAATDFLFSKTSGASASGDTPASIPFYPGLRPGILVDWKAYDTKDGWPDLGGVVKHATYSFVIENKENPLDHTRPLDDLLGLVFVGQEAIWYAAELVPGGDSWSLPTLASSQVVGRGTVTSADFKNDTFSVRVIEKTAKVLDVPTTPIQFYGRGGGLHVETGGTATTGARITRADHADIRGTGDQAFATCFSVTSSGSPATHVFIDNPIFRMQCVPGSTALNAQIKNAAGTWMTVGTSATYSAGTVDTFSVMVNYDLSATAGHLYVDGVYAGSTIITGGIFAASAGTTTFYNDASPGEVTFTHWFFRHWTRFLAAAEIEARTLYTFDPYAEASLTCALEMNERTDESISDDASNVSATVDGFTDSEAAWRASQTGESSMSYERPDAVIGCPFNIPGHNVDVSFGDYATGHEGAGMGRQVRAILSNGARMRPTLDSGHTLTFTAANSQIDGVSFAREPAAGQRMTWDTGPNAGTLTVLTNILSPLIGRATTGATNSMIVSEAITDDASRVGTIADFDDEHWSTSDSAEFEEILNDYREVYRTAPLAPSERISLLVGNQLPFPIVADADGRLVTNFLRLLGPKVTPTATNLEAVSLRHTGWRSSGDRKAIDSAHELAKRTPSSDYGPSVVFYDPSDALQVVGADKDSSGTTDWTFPESAIKSADPAESPREYGTVRVRYGKNESFSRGDGAEMARKSTRDPLATALGSEWRSVTSDVPTVSNSSELVVDTSFLRPTEAQLFGDAVAETIDSGILYKVELRGPFSASETIILPFDIVTVTWSADSLLSSGKKGLAVRFKVNRDWSATLILYFET